MPKILITGGLGFIGRHLQEKTNADIYDLKNGDDIRDKYKLDTLLSRERYDIIVNLAARAGVSSGEEFYEEFFSTNCVGLKTLIDICKKYNVKLVHYSSSAAINARSIYGITKLAGERMIESSDIDYVIIRPFTVIGEGSRKEMVFGKWLNQYQKGEKITFNGDGTSFRGYTYVDDLIDGTIKSFKLNKEKINLGGNQKVTLEELWNIFKEIYPDAERDIIPYPIWDEPGEMADIIKAKKLLNWKPKADIKNKIKELWKSN